MRSQGSAWLFAVLIVVAIVFFPLLFNDFHTDDFFVLEIMRDGFSWHALAHMENPANFRPLTNLVIYLRYFLFGASPALWYLLNIILHLLNVALVYAVAGGRKNPQIAAAAALIFGLYFQHFEAVVWLYGIVRLLAGIAVASALLFQFRFLEQQRPKDGLACVIFLLLALLCAEDCLAVAIYLAAAMILLSPTPVRQRFLFGLGVIGTAAVYVAARVMITSRPTFSTPYFFFGHHLWRNLLDYAAWLSLPQPDHPYIWPVARRFLGENVVTYRLFFLAGLVATIASLAWGLLRRGRSRGAALFVIFTLLPGVLLAAKVTSKLLYLPSIGLAVVWADLAVEVWRKRAGWRWLWRAVFVIFIVAHVAAIELTISEYRANQRLVATLLKQLDELGVDWDAYDFWLFDNVPRRTRLGAAMRYKYALKNKRLFDRNQAPENQPDISRIKEHLERQKANFILVDFASGRPVVIESHPRR